MQGKYKVQMTSQCFLPILTVLQLEQEKGEKKKKGKLQMLLSLKYTFI
jgi:hypothetical protein